MVVPVASPIIFLFTVVALMLIACLTVVFVLIIITDVIGIVLDLLIGVFTNEQRSENKNDSYIT